MNNLWPVEPGGFSSAFYIESINLDVKWYGILVMLGFLVSAMTVCFRAKTKYKLNYDCIFYFFILCVPVSLLGARFWSCAIGDAQWSHFINFKSGGLAIQGGVVFGIIAALIYFPLMFKKPKYHVRCEEGNKVYIRKPSMWILADIVFPVILLGQAIGRWGNFFNGEIFGPQTTAENLEWLRILMPGVFDKMQAVGSNNPLIQNGAYYQPLFLYESLINVIVFLVIYFVLPNFKQIKVGVIGSLYFVVYPIIRLSLEPLRFAAFEFGATYVMSSLMLVCGIVSVILAQFVCPRFREYQIIFCIYCKYIKRPMYLILRALKVNNYENLSDKVIKEYYGFNKEISFKREQNELLYYWN